ncbi:MAG: tRNA lysidine(34) synthetase TilS [Dehalococcoidales bacterium]|nr:tRNA lysidine(34) synthetase TilS [Dehalococcoidales bacterium]
MNKSLKERESLEALEEKVRHFTQEHQLILNQRQLLVAVSGGPDSVCLLHILIKLSSELDMKLHIAHLNHRLRGAESDADAQYVSQLAHQLGIPATIGQYDVKAYQVQQRTSLEEAAREKRYTFLAEVARSIGTDRVAVGHTIDDNVETILLHLIRGTGTRGLRGLQPSSLWQSSGNSLTVIRPLLNVSRQETVEYCQNHQFSPRIDATNLSLSPLRNRIRHQLLPLLRSYNPRVSEALLRTARIASDNLDLLDIESAPLWGRVVQRQEDTIILNKKAFLELPRALQRHLLRAGIEELLRSLKDIETRHIEEIMNALTKPAGKRLNLPGSLVFSVEYNRYLISLDPAALSPFPILTKEFTLKIPGKTVSADWHVEASISSLAKVVSGQDKGNNMKLKPTGNFTAHFDLEKVGSKVIVRRRQTGDRFQPLGMSQPKKLGKFMIDAKIPRAWRERVPIVCSPEQVLWVVGWHIDNRVKVTDETKQVLSLEFKHVSILGNEDKIC